MSEWITRFSWSLRQDNLISIQMTCKFSLLFWGVDAALCLLMKHVSVKSKGHTHVKWNQADPFESHEFLKGSDAIFSVSIIKPHFVQRAGNR